MTHESGDRDIVIDHFRLNGWDLVRLSEDTWLLPIYVPDNGRVLMRLPMADFDEFVRRHSEREWIIMGRPTHITHEKRLLAAYSSARLSLMEFGPKTPEFAGQTIVLTTPDPSQTGFSQWDVSVVSNQGDLDE